MIQGSRADDRDTQPSWFFVPHLCQHIRASREAKRGALCLTAEQFLRRHLQHVPPRGQHRVRYFGWLHPSATARRAVVETLLAVVIVVRATASAPPWHVRCPHCHAFALVLCGVLARGARDPP